MLKPRQKLDKYRVERRIADGAFAVVYQAYDTVEGVRVALKVPQQHLLTPIRLADFRKEVRLTAKLDHPNILPIKTAGFLNGLFVIVYPLGEESLEDRMSRRLSVRKALLYAEQTMEALAHAHGNKIIHCDVKPSNLILFSRDRLRLADFGIAKFALRTLRASGSGTVGYIAPEQALGKPSFRSDVFSVGLILHEMLTGRLPEWPFDWPPPGLARVRQRFHPDLIAFLRRSMEVDSRRRYENAATMLAAFRRIKSRVVAHLTKQSRRKRTSRRQNNDWRVVRFKAFRRSHGSDLETNAECTKCGGPVSEPMRFCPWCSSKRKIHRGPTRFPGRCKRCGRGMKLDWRFCPWCYGGGYAVETSRQYSDRRYRARCRNSACERKRLMPFMRYCPWCRTKVRQEWKIPGSRRRCPRCRWAVLPNFWESCPWCGRGLKGQRA